MNANAQPERIVELEARVPFDEGEEMALDDDGRLGYHLPYINLLMGRAQRTIQEGEHVRFSINDYQHEKIRAYLNG